MGRGLRGSGILAFVMLAACQEGSKPVRTGPATDAFQEERRVVLEESPSATIGRINDMLPLDDRFLVADGMSNRILSFDWTGRFETAIGRSGDGPGEFRTPTALLARPDGTILVSDLHPRLTRISVDLELLEVYPVRVPHFVGALVEAGDDVIVEQWASRVAGDNFALWDPDNGLSVSFDPRSDLVLEVPYWNARWKTWLTASAEHLYAADNMVYPFRRYTLDREFVDTVGTPPPSWRQARKPEFNEFSAATGQRGAAEWMRSFTVIDGLFVVGEDMLVVTHRERVTEYPTDDVIRADVYRIDDGVEKVWEDVVLPGPVLWGGDCLWLVVEVPPSPWTLACWVPVS